MSDNQKDPRNDQYGSGQESQQGQSQQGGRKETDPNNPTARQQGSQQGRQQSSQQERSGSTSGKTGTDVEDRDKREEEEEEEEDNTFTGKSGSRQNPGTQNPNSRRDQ